MARVLPSPLRVRFAPSPTGYLHVGGARTALFNWLLARHAGGTFLLRIEDTDKARSTDDSTRAIFDGMTWLGLDWDEPVVFQGANVAQHRGDAYRLLEAGKAYRCFCTAAELDARRATAEGGPEAFKYDRRCDRLPADEVARRVADGMPFTIRFRVPEGVTEWMDLVHDRIAFPNKDLDDFVILRSDGTPIYNLAVVSDDIAMRVTLVLRGDDHISNTPKQILLYEALGAELPMFGHLPMILGTDGKKLSKRHGATAVGDYRHEGILPSAMCNFLALLGWSPGGDREVMSRDEMIQLFDPEGLLKKAAVFDPKKLEWMNGQHLATRPLDEVAGIVVPALVAAGYGDASWFAVHPDWTDRLLMLLRVRARTVDDLVRQAAPFFGETVTPTPEAVAKGWKDRAAAHGAIAATIEVLQGAAEWTDAVVEPVLRERAAALGLGVGAFFQAVRVALMGGTVSPPLFDVMALLGRDVTLARLRAGLAQLA